MSVIMDQQDVLIQNMLLNKLSNLLETTVSIFEENCNYIS